MNIRRHKNKFLSLIPYFIGSGILFTIYPTLAFDYSIPCLFGFIPLVIYWTKPFKNNGCFSRGLAKYSFFIFLITASFSINIINVFSSESIVIYGYILFAVALIILPLLNPNYLENQDEKASNFSRHWVIDVGCLAGLLGSA